MSAATSNGAAGRNAEDLIARIRRRLGDDAVLLAVAKNAKNPIAESWQKFTAAKMGNPAYLTTLDKHWKDGGNIGVLLGENSGGLYTIDIDLDAAVDPFLTTNPKIAQTLRTKRVRGGNVWLRIIGQCPPSAKLKTRDGKDWGEWRGNGNQTVISGQAIDRKKGETEPTIYSIANRGEVVAIYFEEIVWPDNLVFPWAVGAARQPKRDAVARGTETRETKPDKSAVREMLAAIPRDLPHDEWIKVIAAVGDALTEEEAIEVLNEWDPEREPGGYVYKFAHRLEDYTVGTLIYMAKQAGWDGFVWPGLLPLPPEHPPVAPFDFATLPNIFVPYVRDVAERMQCPPDYVAVGLLCAVGCLLGRKIGIHPKRKDDWLAVCNLWGAIVGPPSVMKSPALKEALLPLNKLVAEAIERHKQAMADYAEDREIHAAGKKKRETELTNTLEQKGESAARDMIRERAAKDSTEPKCERLIVNDCTAEKLQMLLNENPNGVLQFRDELAGWLRSMDRDGHENDRAFYLESWNGSGSYTSDRVGRGTTIVQNAIVSVCGGMQPGVLAAYVREAIANGTGSDGLLQRFGLIVWPETTKQFKNVDRYPDKEAKEAVMNVFRRLHNLNAGGLEGAESGFSDIPALRFTEEAQVCFDQWREQFENGLLVSNEHPALVAHLTKHRKLVPVLALLIHLIDGGTGPVELDPLKKALLWHEYLKTHVAKVYGVLRNAGTSPAREILRRIRAGDIKGGFTARDVYRRHWSGLDDATIVHAGLDALTVANYLREVSTATDGKPLVRYRINPQTFAESLGTAVPKVPKAAVCGLPWASGTNGTPILDAELLNGLERIAPATIDDPAFQ